MKTTLQRILCLTALFLSAFGLQPFGLSAATPAPRTLLVLAGEFQFTGGWLQETRGGSFGPRILRASGSDLNAFTAINVSSADNYTVWVRAVDFVHTRQGDRRYAVAINGARLPGEAGRHGRDEWAWEKLGTLPLPAGDTAIELIDVTRFYGRCDALLFTTDATLDPNALSRAALLRHRVTPLVLKPAPVSGPPRIADNVRATAGHAAPATPVATLAGDRIRIRFVSQDGSVRRITEVATPDAPDGWIPLPGDPDSGNDPESLFILHTAENTLETGQINPRWRNPANALRVRVGSRDYTTGADADNPWRAAPLTTLTARSARALPDGGVELAFADDTGKITARSVWRVAPGRGDFEVTTTLAAWANGYYSVISAPFAAHAPADVTFNLLPPLYQFQRRPVGAKMVPDTVTPQPLSLIELPPDGALPALTLGVAASPAGIPFEWPHVRNARYGFALQADDGRLQPAVFQPVLGFEDSRWRAGETHTLRWRVFARAGDWRDTLAYATQRIFNVTDYRHPVEQSITRAARNIFTLMTDEDAGGWDARLKGFWNIEAPGTVTHSAPLAVVSAAVLADDEALYVSRALPTIEYTLTRTAAHFALEVPKTQPVYADEKAVRLATPSRYYGAAYWQGLDSLLGPGANPWLADLARRAARAGSVQHWIPKFSDTLALYRLEPRPELLDTAVRQAAEWVAREIDGRKTGDIGYAPFYNHDFIPVWWDLLALHELTGDARWLEAARTGAMLTVAGLRSQPAPPAGNLAAPELIHKGNDFIGNTHLWWRGGKPFRLGWPRQPGDVLEHTVPAWIVSPVGLSLEQPSTFFAGASRGETEGFQTILMSSWTPSLLRLHALTRDPVYRDSARNGIVGRFGNYPGYYLRGFTDLPQSARYPYKGPDVTSIYYHHIPPHLAFTLDWLFAEAELRSGGEIKFPWAQQAGYVWFNNRVFGQGGGEIFGEHDARPLLPHGVTVDDPGLNWIAARTPERFWVVLMNDASDARPARVQLDAAALRVDTQQPVLVRTAAPGASATEPAPWTPSLTVPPRGLVALGFASTAAPEKAAALPPVTAGPIAADLGGPWETLHAWRIRSPFGKDSLYLCLTGRPAEGSKVELLIDGAPPATPRVVDRFPFELTVYPWPVERPAKFRLRLTTADGRQTITDDLTLSGTASR
ncbi:hypothetical protein OpiT1DRAFT_01865 [Opitutaceae bacterium TAV1]|nr:hypothetical protein OpiT1DRAFT_01865 [Opitutaceae bacterium TAV1]